MKTVNILIMLLMLAFALREGYEITVYGPNVFRVIFLLLFSVFAVRRFLRLSTSP